MTNFLLYFEVLILLCLAYHNESKETVSLSSPSQEEGTKSENDHLGEKQQLEEREVNLGELKQQLPLGKEIIHNLLYLLAIFFLFG